MISTLVTEDQDQAQDEDEDNQMASSYKTIAGVSGAFAVLLGAFGAHALKNRVTAEELEVWKTASTYHFVHTLALMLNTRSLRNGQTGPMLSNRLFIAGMIVFSGSLYTLVLTGQKKLGAITPIGGLMLVGGWTAMAYESYSA